MTTALSTTTEEILQEEGAEETLLDLAGKVSEAEDAIREVLRDDPEKGWTARELQDAAAFGRSSSVMSIAYLNLLKAGELRIDPVSQIVEAT